MKLTIISLATVLFLLPLPFLRASTYGLGDDQLNQITSVCSTGSIHDLRRYMNSQAVTKENFGSVLCYALLEAAANGKKSLAMFLLSRSERLDYDSAIVQASLNGHADIVKLLLTKDSANPGAWDNQALMQAASDGYFEVVEALLADRRVHLDPETKGYELMSICCEAGQAGIVKILLSKGISSILDGEHTCFFAAVEGNHAEIVRLLLDENIEAASTAVETAAAYGYTGILKVLLADHRVKIKRFPAYHLEAVKLLLADPRSDAYIGSGKHDLLKSAVSYSEADVEIVKLLLADKRIDPSASEAPLYYAINGKHDEIVKILLDDGRCSTEGVVLAAARSGYTDLFMKQFSKDDLQAFVDCLEGAIDYDQEEILKIILGGVDEETLLEYSDILEYSLKSAIGPQCFSDRLHKKEILKILLEFCPSEIFENIAAEQDLFLLAANWHNVEAVEVLLADGRADPTCSDFAVIRHAWRTRDIGRARRSGKIACLLLADMRVNPVTALQNTNSNAHLLMNCLDGNLDSFKEFYNHQPSAFKYADDEEIQVLIRRNSDNPEILRFIRRVQVENYGLGFGKLIEQDQGLKNMIFNETIGEARTRADLEKCIEKYVTLKGLKGAAISYGYGDSSYEGRRKVAYANIPDELLLQIAFMQ